MNYIRLPLSACALLTLALLTGQASRADTVTLTDGTVREGKILSETRDTITFQLRMGNLRGSIVIPRSEIAALQRKELPPDPVVVVGQELTKGAEAETDPVKAAQAWLRLGEFYEQNPGFSSNARASFQKVLLFAPDQPVARAKLGYVKTDKGWQKLEVKKPEAPLEIVRAPEGQQKAAAREDELVIGLRADAEAIRKALEEQANRLKMAPEPQPRRVAAQDAPNFVGDYEPWGYQQYILMGNMLYPYMPGLFFCDYCPFYGFGGFSNYYYSNGYYGTGWNGGWGNGGSGWRGGWGNGGGGWHGGGHGGSRF